MKFCLVKIHLFGVIIFPIILENIIGKNYYLQTCISKYIVNWNEYKGRRKWVLWDEWWCCLTKVYRWTWKSRRRKWVLPFPSMIYKLKLDINYRHEHGNIESFINSWQCSTKWDNNGCKRSDIFFKRSKWNGKSC